MSKELDSGGKMPYDVGYRKPPKATQFQKGRSGNPQGRPKGAKSIQQLLQDLMNQRVRVTKGGKTVHISQLEVVLTQLFIKAAGGELKAIRELRSMVATFAASDNQQESAATVQDRDAEVMEHIVRRIQEAQHSGAPGADNSQMPDENRNDEGEK